MNLKQYALLVVVQLSIVATFFWYMRAYEGGSGGEKLLAGKNNLRYMTGDKDLLLEHKVWTQAHTGRFGSIKKFRPNQQRKDMSCPDGAICRIMKGAGLKERERKEKTPALYWGIQMEIGTIMDIYAKENLAGINMIPGLVWLGDKVQLGQVFRDCIDDFGTKVCDHIPLTFDFPTEEAEWRRFNAHHDKDQSWIVKPRRGFSSLGVSVIGPGEDVPEGEFAVQQYISSPLLFMNHKFDMRVWALVASVNPLRMYLLQDAFPKVATHEFSNNPADFSNLCIHITSPTKACDLSFLNVVPNTARDTRFLDNLTTLKGGRVNDGAKFWSETVWPSVTEVVTKTVLMHLPEIVGQNTELKDAVPSYKGFAHMAFDVIVDQSGRAFAEEVNLNGFLQFAEGMNGGQRGGEYLANELRLLGIGRGGYKRMKYQLDFMDELKEFCASRAAAGGCSTDDLVALQELKDEEMHSGAYTRVFPPLTGVTAQQASFFKTRHVAVTRRTQVTWDFVQWEQERGQVKEVPYFSDGAITSAARDSADSMPSSFGKGKRGEGGKPAPARGGGAGGVTSGRGGAGGKTGGRKSRGPPLATSPPTPRFSSPKFDVVGEEDLLAVVRDHSARAEVEAGLRSDITQFRHCGQRTDFRCPDGSVCKSLQKAGLEMVEVTKGGSERNLLNWCMQKRTEDLLKMFPSTHASYTNMVPGLSWLGDKSHLAASHSACVDDLGFELCSHVPYTFDFPTERTAWKAFTKDRDPNEFWIVKPTRGYSSIGVHVIAAHEQVKDGDFAVQQYISTPLLFRHHKFDMRMWAVLTSVNPLRVFLLQDAYPKVSTSAFNPNPASFGDLCIHLTSPTKACDLSFLEQVPDTAHRSHFVPGLDTTTGAPVPSWEDVVWPSIEEAVSKTVLMQLADMLRDDAELRAKLPDYDAFTHMAFDVIVHQNGHAYVEEVNFNGFMEFAPGMNGGERGGEYLVEEIHMLGMYGHKLDRSAYQESFLMGVEAFCRKREEAADAADCTAEDIQVLQDMRDEDEHSGSYKRVFPPNDGVSRRGYDRFFTDRGVEPGQLNQITWDFLEFMSDRRDSHAKGGGGEKRSSSSEPKSLSSTKSSSSAASSAFKSSSLGMGSSWLDHDAVKRAMGQKAKHLSPHAPPVGGGIPATRRFQPLELEEVGEEDLLAVVRDHSARAEVEAGLRSDITQFRHCGQRTDFRCPDGSVCKSLQKAGLEMVEVTKGGSERNLLNWCMQKRTEDLLKMFPSTHASYTNMVPGLSWLGDKSHLAASHSACVDDLGFELCSHVPYTFDFPTERDRWTEFVSKRDPNEFWIVKPTRGYSSIGVHVIAAHEQVKDGDYAVQQYISTPLLFRHHKFDMRMWAVLTSVNPLRVFLLQDAYPKVSTSEFNPNPASFGDLCIHLTSPTKACDLSFLEQVPDTAHRSHFVPGLDTTTGAPVPSWEDVVWPSIEEAVSKTVLMQLADMLRDDAELRAKLPDYDAFTHMAFDVIVHQNGHAYVEEVNFNGFMEFAPGMNGGERGGEYLVEEIHMLGMYGHKLDRSAYQANFLATVNAFCSEEGVECSEEDIAVLQDMRDEDEHSGSYKRVFPPNDGVSRRGYDRFFTDRGVEPGQLNQITWDFLEWHAEMQQAAKASEP